MVFEVWVLSSFWAAKLIGFLSGLGDWSNNNRSDRPYMRPRLAFGLGLSSWGPMVEP